MELVVTSRSPFTAHLKPGLQFSVDLQFDPSGGKVTDIAPIEVGGRLEASDGTILAQLHEWSEKENHDMKTSRLTAGSSSEDTGEPTYSTKLYAPIGEEGIEYIDELREEAQRDDVFLNVIVKARVLESRTVISSLRRVEPDDLDLELPEYLRDETGRALVVYAWDRDITPGRRDTWHLSGHNSAEFLSTQRQVESEINYRIPSREWTDEFLPVLGAGGRHIVEIPDPDDFQDESVGDGLVAAYEELESAKNELQRGEWRVVVQHTLGLYDAIQDDELWELEDAGYTPEAEGCLNGLRSNFSDYLGKFRHRRGRGGDLQDKAEPHREDAYFMYVMMAGLVQLLARKHSIRQNNE